MVGGVSIAKTGTVVKMEQNPHKQKRNRVRHFIVILLFFLLHLDLYANNNSVFINIENTESKYSYEFPNVTEVNSTILSLMETVEKNNISATVQHLQDYVRRAYDEPQAYQAQDWLFGEYKNMGLNVEILKFTIPWHEYYWFYSHSNSSGNVIAVQPGTLYPDEYIVIGAHYDSFNWDNVSYNSPGADDNGSGTAGLLEIARILSQYQFERSIVYCSFSAEEVGEFGSKTYAARCKQQNMNILGYFNIDAIGYLKPGTPMNISIISPSFSTPLADYTYNVFKTYFPEIQVTKYPNQNDRDSDHTPFNQQGYYGVWTREDLININPYFHTVNDVIGTSFNNSELSKIITQMNIASIATLAGICETPVITINTQPATATNVAEGDISAALTVSASVTSNAALYYQWYNSATASNTDGTAVFGATSSDFTIPAMLTAGTYYYFCEVSATGDAASVRSDAATVNVYIKPTIGFSQVGSAYADAECYGETAETVFYDFPVNVATSSGDVKIDINIVKKDMMGNTSASSPFTVTEISVSTLTGTFRLDFTGYTEADANVYGVYEVTITKITDSITRAYHAEGDINAGQDVFIYSVLPQPETGPVYHVPNNF